MPNANEDYSFMRAGRSLVHESSQAEESAAQQNMVNRLAVLQAVTQAAMDHAATLCKHAGGNVVTADHIRAGLIFQTHKFLQRGSLETDVTTQLASAKEMLEEYLASSGEASSEEESEGSESSSEDEIDEIPGTRVCTCDLCVETENLVLEFPNWTPTNEFETALKSAIERGDVLRSEREAGEEA